MKKVLVSPGYGAGFATWVGDHETAVVLAEDLELIALVEAGKHKGETTYTALHDAGVPGLEGMVKANNGRKSDDKVEASFEFAKRAMTLAGGYVYCGGVYQLEVRTVSGPYRIEEYDGSESLATPNKDYWW